MTQLKRLIINGTTKIVNKVISLKFVINLINVVAGIGTITTNNHFRYMSKYFNNKNNNIKLLKVKMVK